MSQTTEIQLKIAALTARNGRYPSAAYEFVGDAVREAVRRLDRPRHVTAAELLAVFKAYAYECFGPMTPVVLEEWQVRRPIDVGRMVYELIDIQLLSAAPEDRESDFDIEFNLTDPPAAAAPSSVWKAPKID